MRNRLSEPGAQSAHLTPYVSGEVLTIRATILGTGTVCRAGKRDKALDEAAVRKWVVVDMKQDWRAIYPPEK